MWCWRKAQGNPDLRSLDMDRMRKCVCVSACGQPLMICFSVKLEQMASYSAASVLFIS